MQDRFVCDIGDFGKYGLLRALAGAGGAAGGPRLTLGIVWYLVEGDAGSRSGRGFRYLDGADASLTACDPDLFVMLRELVKRGSSDIAGIQRSCILPDDTKFFDDPVPEAGRHEWLERALLRMEGVELVYLDPDNGLLPAQGVRNSGIMARYATLEEAMQFHAQGSSLVIYHHLSRRSPANLQIEELLARVGKYTSKDACIFAMRYHRGSARLFLVLAAPAHRVVLCRRAIALAESSPWREHFTLIGERGLEL